MYNGEWNYSIIDVVSVLTEQKDYQKSRKYWNKLKERIQEVIDPSLAVERARQTYIKKGYDEEWTNTRIKGIAARNNLTNEWKNRGADTKDYAILTDEIILLKSSNKLTLERFRNRYAKK